MVSSYFDECVKLEGITDKFLIENLALNSGQSVEASRGYANEKEFMQEGSCAWINEKRYELFCKLYAELLKCRINRNISLSHTSRVLLATICKVELPPPR